ncbi:MAG: hypothetical protein ACI97B_003532, partial [Verrucomicrobiales bacterium]
SRTTTPGSVSTLRCAKFPIRVPLDPLDRSLQG